MIDRTEGENDAARNAKGQRRGRLFLLTDGECVALARQGHSPAMAELVRRYTPGVFHLLVRVIGDRTAAADATQEVFLRVYRSLERFKHSKSFKPWLYTIAWNYSRDLLRKRARRGEKRWISLEKSTPPGASEDRRFEIVDERAPGPQERLLQKERQELVQKALGELSPRERGLLVLREFESLSHQQMAEILRCRVGTVKSGLNRARLRLKEALLRLSPELRQER